MLVGGVHCTKKFSRGSVQRTKAGVVHLAKNVRHKRTDTQPMKGLIWLPWHSTDMDAAIATDCLEHSFGNVVLAGDLSAAGSVACKKTLIHPRRPCDAQRSGSGGRGFMRVACKR